MSDEMHNPDIRKVPDNLYRGELISFPGPYAFYLPKDLELVAEGPAPGSRGITVPIKRNGDILEFKVTPKISGRWLYAIAK
jgi:hypothetical protein